jgi:glycosyltransferase involved in cell wall biosynthesis
MRNFTGGCHHSNDCQKYIDQNCSNCPQAKSGFKQIVQNSFQRSIKITNEFARVSLVAPSQWILDKARDSLMWKNREMSLIRNPIPELEPYKKSVQKGARNKIGFISPELTNPFKGFDVFIAALRKMPQDWWRFNEIIIVGNGMVPEFGRPSKITRIEKISPQEMVDIYDELDYLVIPSRQDNFPNVIGEATLRGVNLILSSAGGLNEAAQIFDFPKFQSGDSENLAKCLLNLQMIERGLVVEKAKEMFSYVRAATAYKTLYMSSN